jgi:hypothetical protein
MKVNVYFSFSFIRSHKRGRIYVWNAIFSSRLIRTRFQWGSVSIRWVYEDSVHSPATSSPLAPINFLQSDPPVISP